MVIDRFVAIDSAVGSNYDDVIAGNNDMNLLKGMDGNDLIEGGGGADTIHGGRGNNRLRGNSGDDKFYAFEGSNTIDGGSGFDTVTYADFMSADYARLVVEDLEFRSRPDLLPEQQGHVHLPAKMPSVRGVVVNLTSGTALKLNTSEQDLISSIEHVIGTHYDDELIGTDQDDVLDGLDGDDVISGMDGDDKIVVGRGYSIIVGGDGDDIIGLRRDAEATVDGGTGSDSLDLTKLNCGVNVNLADHTIIYCSSKPHKIYGVEGISLSAHSDVIFDDSSDIFIAAGLGNDEVHVSAGTDIVFAENGDDTIYLGGSGNKTIAGGSGSDRFVIEQGFEAAIFVATITDFSRFDGDKIDLSLLPLYNISNVMIAPCDSAHVNCFSITLNENQVVTLTNVAAVNEFDMIFKV
jgi:Ca2+-binding RTX toxin-like protein